MKCFKSILRHIGYVFAGISVFAAVLAICIWLAVVTNNALRLDRDWLVVPLLVYALIAIGTFMGIMECYNKT